MYEIYDEVFKYTDILNPVSQQTLVAAGKLANLSRGKTLVDLGCGKGFPALLLAGTFGVQVEGFDLGKINVNYANARAKLLNLSILAQFFSQDLKGFVPSKKYDVVASLGIEPEVYDGREAAFKFFRSTLKEGGVLLYTEPVWKKRPLQSEVLTALCSKEDSFLTFAETQQLIQKAGYAELGHFVSTKEDWDVYVRSPIRGLQELIEHNTTFAADAKVMLEDFKMEYEAANRDWDVILWVLKPV
jgi:cyclopropane fatty-acyl-phospholipid synthase-like methyltransferase